MYPLSGSGLSDIVTRVAMWPSRCCRASPRSLRPRRSRFSMLPVKAFGCAPEIIGPPVPGPGRKLQKPSSPTGQPSGASQGVARSGGREAARTGQPAGNSSLGIDWARRTARFPVTMFVPSVHVPHPSKSVRDSCSAERSEHGRRQTNAQQAPMHHLPLFRIL